MAGGCHSYIPLSPALSQAAARWRLLVAAGAAPAAAPASARACQQSPVPLQLVFAAARRKPVCGARQRGASGARGMDSCAQGLSVVCARPEFFVLFFLSFFPLFVFSSLPLLSLLLIFLFPFSFSCLAAQVKAKHHPEQVLVRMKCPANLFKGEAAPDRCTGALARLVLLYFALFCFAFCVCGGGWRAAGPTQKVCSVLSCFITPPGGGRWRCDGAEAQPDRCAGALARPLPRALACFFFSANGSKPAQ